MEASQKTALFTYWQEDYQNASIPWDLGAASPPFVDLWESEKSKMPLGKLVALGCGYGHDAAFFGQQGFDVVGLDYVPEAVKGARERYSQWASYQQADIFQLPPNLIAQFDYALEHTCFCAIPPQRRSDYVQSVLQLLKPAGIFIGLFWLDLPDGGPPYRTSMDEIRELFEPYFEFDVTRTPNSIPARRGQEMLYVMRRK